MSETRLTPTSYVILGLVELLKTATPYDLKRGADARRRPLLVAAAHPALLGAGATGRGRATSRRSASAAAAAGGSTGSRHRGATRWPSGARESTSELYELRDQGLLKLFFGADPATLAEAQLAAHRENLRAFEQLRKEAEAADVPEGVRLTLEAGIGHAREYVRFWSRLGKRLERGA